MTASSDKGSKTGQEIKEDLVRMARKFGRDLESMDLDKEALGVMEGLEAAFRDMGDGLSKKRHEVEREGLKNVAGKDAREAGKAARAVAREMLTGLEKAASALRSELEEDG